MHSRVVREVSFMLYVLEYTIKTIKKEKGEKRMEGERRRKREKRGREEENGNRTGLGGEEQEDQVPL